jgi:hypothetical protein
MIFLFSIEKLFAGHNENKFSAQNSTKEREIKIKVWIRRAGIIHN